ncbi:hypothetical protein KBY93_09405 [Synechococcus sp. J7-Johnson]|uniref:hypothetical protein n=1 Tax=Synechococcus sp. J7-Johnson TaxID=2823737 RepID=UPI0020CEC775|nr:hypothetical protein [Synechococcus sp. J7-Johnson]MCP9840850.1 hypothetical protein [Synechococcus sp. J7-Johnson]
MGGDPRPISSSRAFWELKAEQVMDRVFSSGLPALGIRSGERLTLEGYSRDPHQPEPNLAMEPGCDPAPIDVVVHEAPPCLRQSARPGSRSVARTRSSAAPSSAAARSPQQRPLLISMALLSVLGAGSTLLVWRGWTQASIALQQERTLQLLERLRSVGPLEAAEPGTTAAATTQPPGDAVDGAVNGLPPPPPEEAWVQELEPLESTSRASSAPPLRVPVSGTITRRAPPAPAMPTAGAASGSGPSDDGGGAGAESGSPELVGVVQVPGQSGSAIFQMGGSSTSAAVGEAIGSTGWRLRSASGNSVVIERNGQQQRVSISGGF